MWQIDFETGYTNGWAGTILDGNYPDSVDARLISPEFVVPAAGERPHLRFQSWHSTYEAADYGQLQIRTNGGAWENLTEQMSRNTGAFWKPRLVDLSAYGGESVQIAFHFVADSYGTAAGWYVDDLVLETGPLTMNLLNAPESFENGWSNWVVYGGVWNIGTPSSGPGAAHSGTNLAATLLNGSYPDSVDAWLVSPEFLVPTAGEQPRLRFWSWHSTYEAADYGQLVIRTNGGSWENLTEQISRSTGAYWKPRLVDLSGYGGQTVQIAFRFVADSYGTGSGWYVDDLALETGPLTMDLLNDPEHFENGWGDWYVEGGVWQIGYETGYTNGWAGTILDGNYPDSVDARLISPEFEVPAAGERPHLRFLSWHSTYEAADYGQLQIRANGGSWENLTEQISRNTGAYWKPRLVDLSAYGGQTVQIAFHFVADSYGTAAGWYVDDLVLETGPVTMDLANNPEGFENGWSNWVVYGGVWNIGTPGSGPGVAHSGTNLAATLLNGNYPDSVDAWLVSPEFDVPSAVESPHLRFWSWHSTYEAGDYGQLQIRTNGGPWVALGEQFSRNTGAYWKPCWADLSAYGGQTVQIAFRFVSDSYGTSSGWYVDDLVLETGPVTMDLANSPEGFESKWSNWVVYGGVWNIGTPSSGPGAAHSGTNVAATLLSGNYPDSVDAWLVSPEFDVPSAVERPHLRFWSWHSTYEAGDYGQLQIRTNGGPWVALGEQFSRNTGAYWKPCWVDLSAYGEQTVQIAFRFVSDSYGTGSGWYVDDLALETGPLTMDLASNPEGFENGWGDWVVSGGVWNVGTPSSGPGAAHSGTNLAATLLSGNYPDSVDAWLISPEFVLPAMGEPPQFKFWSWHSVYNANDYGELWIQPSDAGWSKVMLATTSTTAGMWSPRLVDLAAYGGQTVQIAFRFVSDSYGTASGWYVDDLSVVSGQQPEFTVTTTNDSGPGSLRQVMLYANGNLGLDEIAFNIPGIGPHTITPLSPLPTITDPVIIDGYTQPGSSPNALFNGNNAILQIELNGSAAGTNVSGLYLTAGNSIVRGLVINRFQGIWPYGGDGINVSGPGGNVIEGNFIGTDASGTIALPNQSTGVQLQDSPNNLVGGTIPAARNVISGNKSGVALVNWNSSGTTNNRVEGNFIGTDASGRAVIGNSHQGVHLTYSGSRPAPSRNNIGGATTAARNIISGNGHNGVEILSGSTENVIQGNFIGTDVSGTVALPNAGNGVELYSASGNTVGGTTTNLGVAPGNVISGNGSDGIDITDSSDTLVQGNLIGTGASGINALGNLGNGVVITGVVNGTNTIGRNVISANFGNGLAIDATGYIIYLGPAFIGTDISSTQDLGNYGHGIYVAPSGTFLVSAANGEPEAPPQLVARNEGRTIIAFNGGNGATITAPNTRWSLSACSFFSNALLAIDLGNDGLTPNDDCDRDTGPNDFQNYPILSSAFATGSGITIAGALSSLPNTSFDLTFFASSQCDPSGYGEGQFFLGSTNVATATSCNADFQVSFPVTVPTGYFVTATARRLYSDGFGQSSEFGPCIPVTLAPVVLRGRVTDIGGSRIPGASVIATNSMATALADTDDEGNYALPPLNVGTYALIVRASGYAESARILTLSEGTSVQDFQLVSLPPAPPTVQTNRQAPVAFTQPPGGPMGSTLRVFNGSQFVAITAGNAPSPDLITIVMTHGWVRNPICGVNGGINGWPTDIADQMRVRGVSSSIANIVGWDWFEAANACPLPPEENVPAQGVALGQALQSALGSGYSNNLHFIGHSLGALVNAAAANYLHGDRTAQQPVSATPWLPTRTHMTLFDQAEVSRVAGRQVIFDGLTLKLNNPADVLKYAAETLQGWKPSMPVRSAWADNYISLVGFYLPNTFNIALQKAEGIAAIRASDESSNPVTIAAKTLEYAHSYPMEWYSNSIATPTATPIGFQQSFEYVKVGGLPAGTFPSALYQIGDAYHQTPSASDQLALEPLPPENVFQLIVPLFGNGADAVVQVVNGSIQIVGDVTSEVRGVAAQAGDWVKQGFEYVGSSVGEGRDALVNLYDSTVLRLQFNTVPQSAETPLTQDGFGPLGASGESNSVPMAWLPIAFPANATAMAFDFKVEGDPVDDVLVCGIETNNLFSLEAKYIPTNTMSSSRLIDVSPWSGTTNELFFGFMGGTSTNATLIIENIRFYSLEPPHLEIVRNPDNIVLTWPTWSGGYVLECTPTLDSPNWIALTNAPTISGDRYIMTNSWSDQSRFFRLRQR